MALCWTMQGEFHTHMYKACMSACWHLPPEPTCHYRAVCNKLEVAADPARP